MKIKTYEKQGICVLEISGKITGGPQTDVFQQEIVARLEDGQRRFVVDVSRGGFIASIGIGMLIRAFSSVVRGGGVMRLVAPRSARHWNVLATVKLFRIIDTYETLAEALAGFASDTSFPMAETREAEVEKRV